MNISIFSDDEPNRGWPSEMCVAMGTNHENSNEDFFIADYQCDFVIIEMCVACIW